MLWKEIDALETNVYNGAVEAIITLLGAAAAIIAGHMDKKNTQNNTTILFLCTMFQAGFVIWASQTSSLYNAYTAYILFGMIYHYMITIAR